MPIFDRDHADSPEKAYVYILRCADGTLYCGWTNDLAARLDAHNSGKGAKYTRGRGPVELAYSEMFGTQSEAMHREAEIKKLSRPQKQALLDRQTGGEMLTVYDAADRPCGARPRSIVHAQGLRHHVCHLWVVGVRDGVRGIWLQKRQNDRPLYPGFYDLTATGHMDPGETPLTAALREAREEVGLHADEADVTPGGSYRQRYYRADGGFDDELSFVFLMRRDGVPPFAPGPEVAEMVFVPLEDFALAHLDPHDLPARGMDGVPLTLPHEKLACLHGEEWNGVREIVERMKAGDDDCRRVIEAMAYQVAKQIGAMAAVLEGRVDAVLLTGGIAYSETVCDLIRRRTAFVAPVVVMPGEDEMGALAENALRVLRGEERPKIYE